MYLFRLLFIMVLVNHISCGFIHSVYGLDDDVEDEEFSTLYGPINIELEINKIPESLAYLGTQDIAKWYLIIDSYIEETLQSLQLAAQAQSMSIQEQHALKELLQVLKALQDKINDWVKSKKDFVAAQQSLDEIQSYEKRILDRLNWSNTLLSNLPAALQNLVARYKTKIIEEIKTIIISPAVMKTEIDTMILKWKSKKVSSDDVKFVQQTVIRLLDVFEKKIMQFWDSANSEERSKALKDINETIGSIGAITIIPKDVRTILQLFFSKIAECLETINARISTFVQHIDSGIQYVLKGKRIDPNYGSDLLSELAEIPFPPDQALVYKNNIKGIEAIENLIALYNHFKIIAVVCC